MANKDKTALIIGLAIAAGAGYLLLRRPSASSTAAPPATPTLPYAPTAGAAAPASGGGSGWLATLMNLGASIFGGGSSAPTWTPVSTAPVTSSAPASPASGVNYINPSAPALTITAPPADQGAAPSMTDYSYLTDLFG